MEKTKNELKLFPNYFKKIGLGIILLDIIFVVIVGLFFKETDFIQSNKKYMGIFSYDFLLIGIAVICFTKEKIEDERTVALRTQSMAIAFVFGIGFTIFSPFTSLIFENSIEFQESRQVTFIMLGTYLFYFIARKNSF